MKKDGGLEFTIIIGPSTSGLRAAQLRIRPRPCPISGVRAKIIIITCLRNIFITSYVVNKPAAFKRGVFHSNPCGF